jgi:acetolactate synthase I/III small subunit
MHSRTRTVLDVLVKNHPGVMSHVCGLFSRRAFNVEAILCLPLGGGEQSRIWLLVNEDERLEQMIRQMRKLQDVLDVRLKPRRGGDVRGWARSWASEVPAPRSVICAGAWKGVCPSPLTRNLG